MQQPKNSNKKILLVGGAGYIGSHIVQDCLNAGYQVRVLDNFSSSSAEHLPPEVEWIEGDICELRDVQQALAGGISAVIHLAALKKVGESMAKPGHYATKNISGTIQLLNAMVAAGVKHLVFSSSCSIYGNPQYLPLDEKHPKDPVSFYGFTKLEIERILVWYSRLLNFTYVSLRYFNVAGYYPEVKSIEKEPQNLLPVVMEVLQKKRPQLEIYGADYDTKDGTCIRDYIHIQDLSQAHLLSLQWLADGGQSEVFNLGTEKGSSVKEIIDVVEKLSGKALPQKIVARRAGDAVEVFADSSQASKLLGWKAEHSSLEEIIQSMLQAYACQV